MGWQWRLPAQAAFRHCFGPKRRMTPVKHHEGRNRAVKIYFVARSFESTSSRVTQGVVERDRWVTLKKELAGDGFVVTYWCSLEDDVQESVAA